MRELGMRGWGIEKIKFEKTATWGRNSPGSGLWTLNNKKSTRKKGDLSKWKTGL